MKKIIIAALILVTFSAILSSCGASHKTGCPNNQGIIH